jgi:hypothetical protein
MPVAGRGLGSAAAYPYLMRDREERVSAGRRGFEFEAASSYRSCRPDDPPAGRACTVAGRTV